MSIALVPKFGWPPYLPTKLAAAYCSESRFKLYRAVAAGLLKPIASKGRTWIFAREDLDAYMTGGTMASAPSCASMLHVVDGGESE